MGCLNLQISNILSDKEYRQDIARAINPAEILNLLEEKGLMEESERETLLKLAPQKGAEIILDKVEERGGDALTDFLWCLEQTSDDHLGHKYALEVLTNKEYDLETLAEIVTSIALKNNLQDLHTRKVMSEGVDVVTIFPHLLQIGLISEMEKNELSKPMSRRKRFIKLKSIIANKGPLASLYFIQALINAKEENPHLYEDIFVCLFGPPDDDQSLWEHCLAIPS